MLTPLRLLLLSLALLLAGAPATFARETNLAVTYTSNTLNQLRQKSGAEEATYEYDANGNRVLREHPGGAEDVYTYDYENRLVKVVADGMGQFDYLYDYRTRRVEVKSGADPPRKVVFSGGVSVREYEGTNPQALTVEYVRGSDMGGGVGGILYTLRGGAPSFTHYNNRGDVTAKTDGAGELTYQASYEAFGTRRSQTGDTLDRQKANTKEEDPTGLLNEGFRYRDLDTGVFLTRDPAGFVDGPNLYTYVQQNPWSKFDSEGLFWSAVITAGFAAYDTCQYVFSTRSRSQRSRATLRKFLSQYSSRVPGVMPPCAALAAPRQRPAQGPPGRRCAPRGPRSPPWPSSRPPVRMRSTKRPGGLPPNCCPWGGGADAGDRTARAWHRCGVVAVSLHGNGHNHITRPT